MACQAYEDDLRYMAGEMLPASREAHLRAHLAYCAACRAALDAERALYQSLDAALREQINADVPAALATCIHVRVRAEAARHRTWLSSWAFATAFAGLVLAVALLSTHRRASQPRLAETEARVEKLHSGVSSVPQQSKSFAGLKQREHRAPDALIEKSTSPAVLIPPGQQQAMTRFLQGVQRGELNGELLLADRRKLESPLPDILPLEFDSLDVAPLEIAQPESH